MHYRPIYLVNNLVYTFLIHQLEELVENHQLYQQDTITIEGIINIIKIELIICAITIDVINDQAPENFKSSLLILPSFKVCF